MGWVDSGWLVALSGIALVLALGGLANGYRAERDAKGDAREAFESGVVSTTTVDGSLWSGRSRRLSVRFTLGGIQRRVSVVPDRAYPNGTSIRVAYLPSVPDRFFIGGATPWTWWRSVRTTFAAASLVAFGLFVGSLLIRFERRRWRRASEVG